MRMLLNTLSLGFSEKAHEAAFKNSYQASLPQYIFVGSIVLLAHTLGSVVPLYLRESRSKCEESDSVHSRGCFTWGVDDPRTLHFSLGLYLVAMSLLFAITTGLRLLRKAALRGTDLELTVVVFATTCFVILPFMSPWRVAALFGQDPFEVWVSSNLFSFYRNEVILGVATEVMVTAVNLFIPIRAKWLWFLNSLPTSSYFLAMLIVGSPMETNDIVQIGFMMFTLSVLAGSGAWRNERAAREKWLGQQQLQNKVAKQKKILSQLKAQIHAMKALMSTVCEVVFPAGKDLRVVGSNVRLEELLGPMQGQCLEEKMLDVGQVRERFQSVVAPLLSAPVRGPSSRSGEAGEAPSVVLVPPVTFRADSALNDPFGGACVGTDDFEAEILVADTGMWHGSGEDAWRYLVGLKALLRKNVLASAPPPAGAEASDQLTSPSASRAGSRLEVASSREVTTATPSVSGDTNSNQQHSRARHSADAGSGRSRSSRAPSWAPSLVTIDETGFQVTPLRTLRFGFLELLRTWHLAERGNMKQVAESVLEILEEQGDFSNINSHSSGQCWRCLSMLSPTSFQSDMCPICGATKQQQAQQQEQQHNNRLRTSASSSNALQGEFWCASLAEETPEPQQQGQILESTQPKEQQELLPAKNRSSEIILEPKQSPRDQQDSATTTRRIVVHL